MFLQRLITPKAPEPRIHSFFHVLSTRGWSLEDPAGLPEDAAGRQLDCWWFMSGEVSWSCEVCNRKVSHDLYVWLTHITCWQRQVTQETALLSLVLFVGSQINNLLISSVNDWLNNAHKKPDAVKIQIQAWIEAMKRMTQRRCLQEHKSRKEAAKIFLRDKAIQGKPCICTQLD